MRAHGPAVKGGDKVGRRGGGIVYPRHDEKIPDDLVRFPEKGLSCLSRCSRGAGLGFRPGFAPVPGRDAGPYGMV